MPAPCTATHLGVSISSAAAPGIPIRQRPVATCMLRAGGLLAGLRQVLARDQANQLVLLVGHAQMTQPQCCKDLVRAGCCSFFPVQSTTEGSANG